MRNKTVVPNVRGASLALKVKGLSKLNEVLVFLPRSVGDDQAHIFPPSGRSISEVEWRLAGGVPLPCTHRTGVGLVRVDSQQGLKGVATRQMRLGELGYRICGFTQ